MPNSESPHPATGEETIPFGSVVPERTPDEMAAFLFGDADGSVQTPAPEETVSPPQDRRESPLRPGAELGRYRLYHELGRGGMGVVYRALDHKLGREVALKVLLVADRFEKESIDRFQREALAAAALDHPHIIKVLDVGRLPARDGSHPFYTMELLSGEDLGFAIARGRITPREAVEVTRQVALALAYAHGRGILHRDVKPHNIYLRTSESRPAPVPSASTDAPTVAVAKRPSSTSRATIHRREEAIHALLLDFGLAKLTEREFASGVGREGGSETVAALTRSGEILGTPVYMPPEQVRSAREIDARADVYALGATLYHALTGRPPFEQTTLAELLQAVQETDPRSPIEVNPKLDADLETLCMKCLAKEPKDRYGTAEDLAEDCARYLAGEELLARPVGFLGRLWRKAKRNRQVARLAIGLGAAVLAVVGLVLHFAIVPALRARADASRVAQEQASRKADAEALLAACRAANERLDLGAAEDAACRIVDEYTDDVERGEDLPVAEAHVELARVWNARGDARRALVEFYRAFERVVDTPDAAPALVRIGEQLWAMREVERAQGVFARALDERPDEKDRRRAEWGLARCLAARSEFEEARAMLEGLVEDRQAAGDREEMRRLLAFLTLVTPMVEVPVSLHGYDVGDLDGDARPEVAAISGDGRSVIVGRIVDGRFQVACGLEVVQSGGYGLSEIAVIEVDGAAPPEIVAGGGVPGAGPGRGAGVVAVIGMRDGVLRLRGEAEVPADLRGTPFASADLDGDGARELVVGTSWYDRSIHVFRVAADGLEPGCRIEAGGDVWGVLTRDADADGLPEIWAFVGPWSAYDILCVEYDRAEGGFVIRSRTPFGRETSLDAGSQRVLAGLQWSEDSVRPLVERMGKTKFEGTYRPPGSYEIRFRADLTPEIVPLWTLPWPSGRALGGYATALSGDQGRFAWTSSTGLETPDASYERLRGDVRIFAEENGTWNPLLAVQTAVFAYAHARAHDVDGDGDTELVVDLPGVEGGTGRIGALRVCGLGGAGGAVRQSRGSGSASVAGQPMRTKSPALLAAREAERLGLPEEAERGYRAVLGASKMLEEIEEASLGLLRSLARQGDLAGAARDAASLSARWPRLRLPLQRNVLEAADEAGEWAIALAAARDLSTAPGLSLDEASDLADRSRRLAQLAEPSPVVDAGGKSFLECDLLATSPLFVERKEDGRLRVFSGSDTDDSVFVPLSYDGSALRVSAEVAAERHDWETSLEMGLATGEPWAPALVKSRHDVVGHDVPRPSKLVCAFLEATGDTYEPIRRWFCTGTYSGRRRTDWANRVETSVGSKTRVELEYAPHQRMIRCEMRDVGTSRGRHGRLAQVLLDDDRVFVAILARGIAGMPGHWGVFDVARLRIEAGGPNARLAVYAPRRAADLLLLANGRWIQGRTEEAMKLYDRAIEAADLEFDLAARLSKQGLPNELDAPWAERFARWASVDARVWRALLRAALADPEGAQADLDAAFARSDARVMRLLADSARSLAGRRSEAAAVRTCLTRRGGFDERSELRDFGEALLALPGGSDLAASLLLDKGFEVRSVLVVEEVRTRRGTPPLQEGDRILTYDGRGVRDFASFRKAQFAAAQSGRPSVAVSALRRGSTVRAEIDPREETLVVRVSWEIVARPR